MMRAIAYRIQEIAFGGLSKATLRRLATLAAEFESDGRIATPAKPRIKPGARLSGKLEGIELIAAREGISDRSARMGLSLAFLAPDFVQAAVDGTLPRGLGVSRLMDMPPSWVDQRSTIGIAPSR